MSDLRNFIWSPLFSPRGFLARATLLALLFAGCHLAGWREHTTFISGSAASAEGSFRMSVTMGLVYMLAYFGFVLVVPILLFAAGILTVLQRKFHLKRDE